MKRLLILITIGITLVSSELLAQNVGIGTTTPTNTLHVVPSTGNFDPVRFEGISQYTNEDSILVVNPSTGVIKYMPMADVLSNIPPNVLDSLILNSVINNTDSIFNTQAFKDSVLSVILGNIDTVFTLTRDSLLLDSTFMNTLKDSIDTDIDSMIFANDTLYLYEDNQVLTTYINASADTAFIDSLIIDKSDTLFTIISDSLLNDTLWIKNLDSLLSIYGDTIYFNDSSYSLIRDSLLSDSMFIDSLISLLGDSIDTDIDSVVLIGDTLHIHEDGVDASTDISGILDSIRTVDSLFTPDYVIFADSNGRLSEDTTLHFKTAINAKGDRALLLNTDTIINTGNSAWSQLQVYKKETNYEGVVSLEDGYLGLNMAGSADPVLHLENRAGSFNNTQPLDTSVEGNRAIGTIVFLGRDSTTTRGTQATFQGTSKSYDNQRLLTGFLFTGRTTVTPLNPKGTYGYNFPHYHNNSELLLELNNDGNGSMQAHFYENTRNDTTPINNFLYTDANGVFQSKNIDTLIQLMRDSIDDADWKINANGTGLEAAAANDNLASGNYSIVAGQSDTATGQYSVISGGRQNKATGSYSNVTGGFQNLAQGSYSSVSGYRDTTLGSYAGILSGRENLIESSGSYSVIPGGFRNKITGSSSYTSISGANNFTDYARYSFIYGENDTIMRHIESSFITGSGNASIADPGALTGWNFISGRLNKIRILDGNNTWGLSIIGGYNNSITGRSGSGNAQNIIGSYECIIEAPTPGEWNGLATIVGSIDSRMLTHPTSGSNRSIILGGASDTIHGSEGTALLGGVNNKAYNGGGWHALVGGANNQIQQQWFSGIFAGWRNKVTNSHSAALIAGRDNELVSGNTMSVLIGGDSNRIINSADKAIILGGSVNSANNYAQVVLGHYSSSSIPAGSSSGAIDPDNILFKIGNGTGPSDLNDAMVVKANGNVGIGVFNPSVALEVNGDIIASGTITPSDKRYKTNIKTLDNALEKLLKLRGVNYDMREKYKERGFGEGDQIGVIAQEVEAVFPELIQTNSITGFKGVDYSKFTPILIEAIKEQQEIINTNKEEITTLKSENNLLKERLEKLEKTINTLIEK